MTTADEVSAIIVKRHRARDRFQSVRALVANDLRLAYDVQDRVIQELAGSAGVWDNAAGYKIGLTTPRMQTMCGIDQPIAGTIFAGRLHTSPVAIDAATFIRLGVESEIAVQVGKPMPDAASIDSAGLLAHLSQICAAFELIDDSDADYTALDAASLIADNSWNAGLVLGPPSPAAKFSRLSGLAGVLFQNGKEVERGNSSDVMGDPLNVIVWLAKHLASRGVSLQPGQWITTGSICKTRFAVTGESYRFEVEGLAGVEVQIR